MKISKNPGFKVDLSKVLVVGISSRALFDLEYEDRIFKTQGLEAFRQYQREHENDVLQPGAAFPLVTALLNLNEISSTGRKVEVVVMSKNHPDASLRLFNSIREHELDITRAALAGGADLAPYMRGFHVDLFLSMDSRTVQSAINSGFAGALIYPPPEDFKAHPEQIRFAFDADAVVFSDESERVYQDRGLEAFLEHERAMAQTPLKEGPFGKLFKVMADLQSEFGAADSPIRLAIVTSRNSPAHERVLRTMQAWNIRVDETFFLGGAPKDEILRAFGAHIFFDDQDRFVEPASKKVPAARVPSRLVQGGLFTEPPVTEPPATADHAVNGAGNGAGGGDPAAPAPAERPQPAELRDPR